MCTYKQTPVLAVRTTQTVVSVTDSRVDEGLSVYI